MNASICGLPVLGCFPDQRNVVLNLSAASVGHSNLGGLGPDFDAPPTLAFRSVGIAHDGRAIDLVVSNLSTYTPRNTGNNGITNGHLGEVNLNGGHDVQLRFEIMDSEHGGPVVLQQVYLSVVDIDEFENGFSVETVWVSGFDSYVHASDAAAEIVYSPDSGEVQVTAQGRGNNADNPADPAALRSVEQLRRSVQFSFSVVSSFGIRFGISESTWGRSLFFSGERVFELPVCAP